MKLSFTVSALLLLLLVITGCTNDVPGETIGPFFQTPSSAPEWTQPQTIPVETVPDILSEAQALSEVPEPAAPFILEALPSGFSCVSSEEAQIDYSHTEDGYIMVRYTADTDRRLKVLVKGPSTTYNYNLTPGKWTVFSLSDGNGIYQVGVYKNIADTRYSTVLTADFSVLLLDEFSPFLRSNQYVDYTAASNTVARGLEVTEGLIDPIEKVAAIYDYVVSHLEYDIQKAQTVQSGYLPVLDDVLESGTGICFDYAAMMTAMLRSQQIPCKLVVGYAGTVYHAWISVWTEESGWIDGAIFFDGHVWHRMDPTFASSSDRSQEIMEFIRNGNYTVKYLY